MDENELSFLIRGCIFSVYNNLGPGLLESVYINALTAELRNKGVQVATQVALPVNYLGQKMEPGYRIDLLVENKVIIEVKSVEEIAPVHHKQILTYLVLSGRKLGLLVNFNTINIYESIYRKVNKL